MYMYMYPKLEDRRKGEMGAKGESKKGYIGKFRIRWDKRTDK